MLAQNLAMSSTEIHELEKIFPSQKMFLVSEVSVADTQEIPGAEKDDEKIRLELNQKTCQLILEYIELGNKFFSSYDFVEALRCYDTAILQARSVLIQGCNDAYGVLLCALLNSCKIAISQYDKKRIAELCSSIVTCFSDIGKKGLIDEIMAQYICQVTTIGQDLLNVEMYEKVVNLYLAVLQAVRDARNFQPNLENILQSAYFNYCCAISMMKYESVSYRTSYSSCEISKYINACFAKMIWHLEDTPGEYSSGIAKNLVASSDAVSSIPTLENFMQNLMQYALELCRVVIDEKDISIVSAETFDNVCKLSVLLADDAQRRDLVTRNEQLAQEGEIPAYSDTEYFTKSSFVQLVASLKQRVDELGKKTASNVQSGDQENQENLTETTEASIIRKRSFEDRDTESSSTTDKFIAGPSPKKPRVSKIIPTVSAEQLISTPVMPSSALGSCVTLFGKFQAQPPMAPKKLFPQAEIVEMPKTPV